MPLHPQAQRHLRPRQRERRRAGVRRDRCSKRATESRCCTRPAAASPKTIYAIGDLDAGGVPVRVYRPSPDDGLPVVVYLHGGGWTIGSVDVYDNINRALANAANAIVVSRPSTGSRPNIPFPAPLDDCWNAIQWVAKNASEFGGDGVAARDRRRQRGRQPRGSVRIAGA